MNVLRLGDRREVNLYFHAPNYREDEALWFPVEVVAFEKVLGHEMVRVRAAEPSDDPMIEDEHIVPFRALRRPS